MNIVLFPLEPNQHELCGDTWGLGRDLNSIVWAAMDMTMGHEIRLSSHFTQYLKVFVGMHGNGVRFELIQQWHARQM